MKRILFVFVILAALLLTACAPPSVSESESKLTPTGFTTAENGLISYILNQRVEALKIYGVLVDLIKNPNPDSVAWTNSFTDNMGQLEFMKAELEATPYPQTLSVIYQDESDYLGHVVTSGYYLLDVAHAQYMAKAMEDFPVQALDYQLDAINYMKQANAELEKAVEASDKITEWLTQRIPNLQK